MSKIIVSIIIVHYKEKKVLYDCLRSVNKSDLKIPFEIIVVDNDEVKSTEGYLKKNFPKVNYIPALENLGYGKGNNLGIKSAKGEYIFILNPDTIVTKGMVEKLLSFIKKNRNVGVVAPTLYDEKGKQYPLQGTKSLTPISGIVGLSFLNKVFPNNHVSKRYWMKDIDRKIPYEADVVPGTAFLMKKSLFNIIGGFDENFFLYFEESDLCKRIKEAGYKIYILPEAKLTHFWAASTPPSDKIKKIFRKSRFYYFKKHYGILSALLVEFFARISKVSILVTAIILIGLFLRFYRFMPNFIFNGEMGTDYMNIWNMIHGSRTLLIGPRTSHEWFFISPIAYWIYIILMLIWNYNAVVINVFWGIAGVAFIPICYFVVKKIFSKNVALISSFLVAVSPAWIIMTRNSRYNPVSAILFLPYLLYLRDSIRDKGKSLFKMGLVLGLTMSFFPSPLLLIPAAIASFLFYRVRPKFKYILQFALGFLIPNITFIIYEFTDRFSIITQLVTWIPYRVLGFFGLYGKNTVNTTVLSENFSSIYQFFTETFVGFAGVISIALFVIIIGLSLILLSKFYKRRNKETAFFLLIINLLVCYIGLFVHGNPPAHYYYVIYPIPLLLTAYIMDKFIKRKILLIGSTLALGVIAISGLVKTNWFYTDAKPIDYNINAVPYTTQIKIVDTINKDAGGTDFSLARIGMNDQFENNFANNYIFLLTIRGDKVVNDSKIRYTIIEGKNNYQNMGNLIFSENNVYVTKTQE